MTTEDHKKSSTTLLRAAPDAAAKTPATADIIQVERFLKTFGENADWRESLKESNSGPTYMMTEYRDAHGHVVAVGTAKGKPPLYQSNFHADTETVADAVAKLKKLPHVKGVSEDENHQYLEAAPNHGLSTNPIDQAVAATRAKAAPKR